MSGPYRENAEPDEVMSVCELPFLVTEVGTILNMAPEAWARWRAMAEQGKREDEQRQRDEQHWVTFAAAALAQLDLGNGGEVDAKWCAKRIAIEKLRKPLQEHGEWRSTGWGF